MLQDNKQYLNSRIKNLVRYLFNEQPDGEILGSHSN
jgi:hypothetical protein